MLVQFGNYWIQRNSSDSQIGLGLRPRQTLIVLGIFFIQLFPNWIACSPITYTNMEREVVVGGFWDKPNNYKSIIAEEFGLSQQPPIYVCTNKITTSNFLSRWYML